MRLPLFNALSRNPTRPARPTVHAASPDTRRQLVLRTWSIKLEHFSSTDFSSLSQNGTGANGDILSSIGWNAERAGQFTPFAANGLAPGRVARVDGRSVLLITAGGSTRAEASTGLHRKAETTEELPAIGDWVGYRARPLHETDLVEAILPRRSQLVRTRQVMDSAVERQVVAANLDFAFIVHAANNVNLRRLEREAAQVASSGAEAVIVFNKSDLHDDIFSLLDDVEVSVPLVPVHAVSGITGDGIEALERYIRPDRTVAFIGASGVGKSTLTNRLLGRDVMDTGGVREDDQRGRHTTTARHLLPLDGGGALIDTPGMRAVGLLDAGEGVAAIFNDISQLALRCRFNDCTHNSEPGCAVQDAVRTGELDEGRFGSYEKLSRELEFIQSKSDLRLRHARRDVWKQRAKNARQKYKARDRFGRS